MPNTVDILIVVDFGIFIVERFRISRWFGLGCMATGHVDLRDDASSISMGKGGHYWHSIQRVRPVAKAQNDQNTERVSSFHSAATAFVSSTDGHQIFETISRHWSEQISQGSVAGRSNATPVGLPASIQLQHVARCAHHFYQGNPFPYSATCIDSDAFFRARILQRESVGGAYMYPNPHGVSRSLSCSHLMYVGGDTHRPINNSSPYPDAVPPMSTVPTTTSRMLTTTLSPTHPTTTTHTANNLLLPS